MDATAAETPVATPNQRRELRELQQRISDFVGEVDEDGTLRLDLGDPGPLIEDYLHACQFAVDTHQLEDAQRLGQEAVDYVVRLRREAVRDADSFLPDLAETSEALWKALAAGGKTQDGQAARQAVLRNDLPADGRARLDACQLFGERLLDVAEFCRGRGIGGEAAAIVAEARQLLDDARRDLGEKPFFAHQDGTVANLLLNVLMLQAEVLCDAGHFAAALDVFKEALAAHTLARRAEHAESESGEDDTEVDDEDGNLPDEFLVARSRALIGLGRHQEAEDDLAKAVEARRDNVAQSPIVEFREELAEALEQLSQAQLGQGRNAESRETALEVFRMQCEAAARGAAPGEIRPGLKRTVQRLCEPEA